MRSPLCTLDGVEKRYGRGPAVLGPVSLTVNEGEVLGLRGRNGAGKTTLLKLLAGILRPDGGRVLLREDLAGRVGYVPQDVALYSDLSGLENLDFWGEVYGLPRQAAKTRARWLLKQLDLEEKGRAKVSSYSGGMQRRLHLATALMATPRLLLLDEPTVGADSDSAERILSTLEHLGELGCTTVLVSHRTEELTRVCHRILTLESGLLTDEERLR